ncbi:MAG: hypothetical protein K2P86_00845 [Xanthobacteraceae bacterium]|nr:hypothetical protein [Xanthobacteraceae bacterium]
MKAPIAITLIFAGLFAAGALAQPAPPNDSWRYKLQKTEDGFLRLDAQTGQVSHCKPKDGNWTCETAADDRSALEAEIKRLSDLVAMLEKQANDPVNRFRTPSDQEIEQVMSLFEKMMKRFRGVVENLKKEWEAEAPNKG